MSSRTTARLSTLLAGALAVTLTAACGAGSQTAAKTATTVTCDFTKPSSAVTVRVLAYDSSAIDPFTNTMVKSCSKDNVTVSHDPIDFPGQDAKTPVTLAGATGTYDIIEVYGAEMPNYAAQGKFRPLDDLYAKYKDKYGFGNFDSAMVDAFKYNGKLYAIPMQANVTTFVYRKDVLDGLSIPTPKTLADVKAAAQKIQQSGKMKYPVALPLSDPTTFFETSLNAQGAEYRDRSTGKPNFDTPVGKKGWKAYADLVPYMDPQVTTFDQPKVQQQLYSGQAAMAIMYSGRMADLTNPKNSSHSKDFAFASITLDPGGKAVSNLSADGWAIPTNTKVDPDLLFNLIAAASGDEASKAAQPFAYPARTNTLDEAKVPYAAAVKANLANGSRSVPPFPWVSAVETKAAPILINSLKGGATNVDAALAQAQAAAAKLFQGVPVGQ
jgi:multiple sugar transport system substrate-binding protein